MQIDHIVNSVFNSRTYILSAEDAVWLVDCGDMDRILPLVGERPIVGVLLTHAHFDHIYGLPELLGHFPSAKIYTNEWGKEALANDKLNLSRYHDSSVVVSGENVVTVGEEEALEVLDGKCRIYETPGHNPSCLCFAFDDCIFTGDAYIPGVPPVTTLPRCNKEQAGLSEQRIKELSKNLTIYPGHEV